MRYLLAGNPIQTSRVTRRKRVFVGFKPDGHVVAGPVEGRSLIYPVGITKFVAEK